MAKQMGPLLLSGKTGGLVFYSNRYGDIVQMAGKVSKARYQKDESMARRRETAAEFGYSAALGKVIRLAVKRTCPMAEVGNTHNKLSGLIMLATQKDTVNKRGERGIMRDNVEMLQGFNWRKDEPVRLSVRRQYVVGLDMAAGSASLDIAGMVPVRDVTMGDGATHVEITLVVAAVDDVKGTQVNARAESGLIAVDGAAAVDVRLNCSLNGGGGNIWMAGIGVQGYQEVNGEMVRLRGGGGFEIVKAGCLI